MKEVKRLQQEMLNTPGWTKRKSVEIAVSAAEACLERSGDPEHPVDKQARQTLHAATNWLATGEKRYLKIEAARALVAEQTLDAQENHFPLLPLRSARFAVETARAKSEKKAARKAAKAIYTNAMSAGLEHPLYNWSEDREEMNETVYKQELKRQREKIKALPEFPW
jgi:hypothetical protein